MIPTYVVETSNIVNGAVGWTKEEREYKRKMDKTISLFCVCERERDGISIGCRGKMDD